MHPLLKEILDPPMVLAINRNYFNVKDFSTINLKCDPISSPPAQGNVHIKCVSRGAGNGEHGERQGKRGTGKGKRGTGYMENGNKKENLK